MGVFVEGPGCPTGEELVWKGPDEKTPPPLSFRTRVQGVLH